MCNTRPTGNDQVGIPANNDVCWLFPPLPEANDPSAIDQFLCEIQHIPFESRLRGISSLFVGNAEYKGDPWGELEPNMSHVNYSDISMNLDDELIDPDPFYTFSPLDCVTYAEVALALANASNHDDFIEHLTHIRYQNGEINFLYRNHFMSGDWIPNNSRYVEDNNSRISQSISVASAIIDKPNWFYEKGVECPEGLAPCYNDEQVDLQYLTFEQLASGDVMERLPEVSVYLMVGSENLRSAVADAIGSPIIVLHMGFIVRNDFGELIVRHESSSSGNVIDEPYSDYIGGYIDSANYVGLSIFTPLEYENDIECE